MDEVHRTINCFLTHTTDIERILVCYGGPNWRDNFMLGVWTIAIIAILIIGTFIVFRIIRGTD